MQVLEGPAARAALTRSFNEIPVPDAVLARIEQAFGERLTPTQVVERILADVRGRGDDALRDWTEKLDGHRPETLEVSAEEISAARIEPELHDAVKLAIRRVRDFYEQQPAHGFLNHGPDGALGQLVRPIGRVGVYVPGGLAPLISTLIHTGVPAQVAGVPEIIVTTPPGRDGGIHPAILVAAREMGITRIFKVGGAQAVAAMAYGTDGTLAALKLVALKDPKGAQAVYQPAPIIRTSTLKANPQIEGLLGKVFASLDQTTLQGLNAQVALEGRTAQDVAQAYLKSKGFLK